MNVTVIGTGRVARSIASAVDAAPGCDVVEIVGRDGQKARAIADCTRRAVASVAVPSRRSDIAVIAVADDAIAGLAASLPRDAARVWTHTSGSVPASVLAPLGADHGVLYPLQTFPPDRAVGLRDVPVFVEGSTDFALAEIESLGRAVSRRVYAADFERRRQMHIAAVFACNFTNHLWALAAKRLEGAGLPFGILGPLLRETLSKALAGDPAAGQTGPAARGDARVVDAHREMLQGFEREIYTLISNSISETNDSLRLDPHTCGRVRH